MFIILMFSVFLISVQGHLEQYNYNHVLPKQMFHSKPNVKHFTYLYLVIIIVVGNRQISVSFCWMCKPFDYLNQC